MAVTMAAMVALTPFSRIASLSARSPPKCKWAFTQLISCSSTSSRARKLVLYSKPGCCLCDGLKEKLQVAFSLSGPHALHDVELQVRDITSNPEWEKAYQYEIPVLAKVLADGTEEPLPRLSPRLGVELIQKKDSSLFDRMKRLYENGIIAERHSTMSHISPPMSFEKIKEERVVQLDAFFDQKVEKVGSPKA